MNITLSSGSYWVFNVVDWGWLNNPELRKAVVSCLQHVKWLRERGKQWQDFELCDVGVPYHVFRKLLYDYKLFICTYSSSKHKFYRFAVPIEEVEKRVNEYELLSNIQVVEEDRKLTEIPPDFWDVIEGYDDIKEIFLASLKANKPTHILLVGPPATGKSLMLSEVERLAGSVFITAGSMTRVGLRDILLDRKPKYLIIDELDKIKDPNDLSVLLTLMESERVIVTKHKDYREERMKTWVFAGANTTKGLPPELLDRFAIFHLKPYDRDTLKRVIVKTLTRRENVDSELAEYIALKVSERYGSVRDAVRLSRICRSKEDVDRYWGIMIKYKLVV